MSSPRRWKRHFAGSGNKTPMNSWDDLDAWCRQELETMSTRLPETRHASAVALVITSVERHQGDLHAARAELESLAAESFLGGPLSGPAVISTALALVDRRIRSQRH